jgi:hypothetical protein
VFLVPGISVAAVCVEPDPRQAHALQEWVELAVREVPALLRPSHRAREDEIIGRLLGGEHEASLGLMNEVTLVGRPVSDPIVWQTLTVDIRAGTLSVRCKHAFDTMISHRMS